MATFFPSRLLCRALLLWVAVFFCLVVPLHHRGLVALPGAETANDGQSPYCPLCSLWDNDNAPPPADAPIGCAICHLKGNLELPGCWEPPQTLLGELDYLLPPAGRVRAALIRYRARRGGRAPPTA